MKAAVGALSKLGQLESLDFLDKTVSLFVYHGLTAAPGMNRSKPFRVKSLILQATSCIPDCD